MSESPGYTSHHPRWLRPKISTYWWLGRRAYLSFILREISSVFVAWFVIYLLLLVRAVSQGAASYQQFMDWSGTPLVLLANLVSLVFVVLHSVTWFALSAQAMPIRFRGRRVPGAFISGPNYFAWAAVSAVVAWLLIGG